MTDIVRYAFIGTGNVAELHAEALRHLPNTELVGVWSRTHAKAAAFAGRHNAIAYPRLEDLLNDDRVDAVAVLTYPGSIAEYGIACLQAGKHVLLEKPIAATLDEISALKVAAAAAKRLCVPSHNYIYAPDLREARTRLAAGDFGRLSSFWLIYNQKHPASITGASVITREVMVHHAYAAIFFAGAPKRVTALATNVHFADGVSPDQVIAIVEHDNGVISNLWASFGVDDFTSSPWNVFYKLLGTTGGFQKSWNDSQFGLPHLPGWDKAAYRDSFRFTHEFFVNCCLGHGERPLSDLDDAAGALKLIDAVEKSLATKRTIDLVS
jgi:predicted dehydrogenase